MVQDSMSGLTIKSLLIGVVLMGMLTFYISLANNEGQGDIFNDYPDLNTLNQNITNVYTDGDLIETANVNSNLSATYNPELAISSADQSGNAISINLQDITTTTWSLMGVLFNLMFGSAGRVLFTLMMSILAIATTYYFIKSVRTGT